MGLVYVLLAGYLATAGAARIWTQLGLVVLGSLFGHGLIVGLQWSVGDDETRVAIVGLLMVGMGALGTVGAVSGAAACAVVLGGMGLYLTAFSLIQHLTVPLAEWGRGWGDTAAQNRHQPC